MSDEKPKPIGSGFFSLAAGVAFLFLLVGSFCFDLRKVDPYVIFQYWLFFAAAILIIWGCVRIANARMTGLGLTVERLLLLRVVRHLPV
jgi:hypothetical protein